jgi:hypothetical protein
MAEHKGTPSLLDRKATGGLYAWGAFRAQTRYIGLELPVWMAKDDFRGFQAERNEDVDVSFATAGVVARDQHQVKMTELSPVDIRELVEGFRERNSDQLASGAIRRFVIVCPYLTSPARALANSLRIFRTRDFSESTADTVVRDVTLRELRQRFEGEGLSSSFNFILERVDFHQDLGGLEPTAPDSYDRVAARLKRLGVFRGYQLEELSEASAKLLQSVDDSQSILWSKDAIIDFLRRAIDAFRAGPPRPEGDLLLLCHETLKKVSLRPDTADAPDLFGKRRIRHVGIDDTSRVAGREWNGLGAAVDSLVAPGGVLSQALAEPPVKGRVNGSRQGRLNGSRLLIAQGWPLAAGGPLPASGGRVKGAEPFRFRRSRPLTLPSTRVPGLIEAAIRGGGPRAIR